MKLKEIFNKNFKLIFGMIFALELFSVFSYLLPQFNQAAFVIISALFLVLALYKLEYALLVLLVELFISSKGYLFFFEYHGISLSIRIAFWLIVMAVWLYTKVRQAIKEKSNPLKDYLQFEYIKPFGLLFLFIVWGLINGFLNKNGFDNIFFDFNAWLYFALLFPFIDAFKNKDFTDKLLQVFVVSVLWLLLKTFFLLFVFSHNLIGATYDIYRWIRTTGVGEITEMQGGFYRIFFQSHIYVLLAFFLFAFSFNKYFFKDDKKLKENKKKLSLLFWAIALTLAVVLLTFSRSFWLGLLAGLVIFFVFTLIRYKWKKTFVSAGFLLLSLLAGIIAIVLVVKFPYPNPKAGLSAAEALKSRTQANEAAVSSRWALLPKLMEQIKQQPVLGKGFGKTVTYQSSDPRVLEQTADGQYTTYAFEWGWLDIWLKLGLLGMLLYLYLMIKIFVDSYQFKQDYEILGLSVGLIVIIVVSVFSPFTNHPLGIGYLLLSSIIIGNRIHENNRQKIH